LDRDAGDAKEFSVVLVRGHGANALVPTESFGRWPAVPSGSVSLEGIRRAASKVREEDGRRNLAAIAEATLASGQPGCDRCAQSGNR